MPTCLFFCEDHGLASRLAESLFNVQAPRGWRSTSAGLTPSSEADPRAEAVLTKLGYPAPKDPPRPLEKDLVSFMRVVVAVAVPATKVLPDWLAPKVDRRIDVPDPRTLQESELQGWMEQVQAQLEDVLALCRERTPRPFG